MKAWIAANPMTFLLGIVFVIVAIVGGVIVIIHETSFTFEDYTNALVKFALAIGIFGAGRAIKNGLNNKDK